MNIKTEHVIMTLDAYRGVVVDLSKDDDNQWAVLDGTDARTIAADLAKLDLVVFNPDAPESETGHLSLTEKGKRHVASWHKLTT